MARIFLFILAILICGQATFGYPSDITSSTQQHMQKFWQRKPYWQIRRKLLLDENHESRGGDLELSPIETKANDILMKAKEREIYDGSILSLIIISSHEPDQFATDHRVYLVRD